jgi:predicted alpha/beta superfamily hydrolase
MKHLQEKSEWALSKKGVSLLALVALLNGCLLAGCALKTPMNHEISRKELRKKPQETAAANPLEDRSIKIGEKFTLHSRILNEDRPYWVYLPPSYLDATFAPKQYPVLYLLDGESHFLYASGMVQFMSGSMQIPELIVVAIPNTDRLRDLTPSHTLKNVDGRENPYLASSGGGDAFLKFLKEELLPQIDSRYRTIPYRILMGHSLGGEFVVNAFLDQPSIFQAYIAIDPALWWDDQIVLQKAKKVLPQATDLHGSVYISTVRHSAFEGFDPNTFDIPCEEFAALIKTNASPQLRSKFQRFDSEDHDSIPLMGLYNGLLFTFDGYKPSIDVTIENPITLNEHFAEISKRLGFKVLPPEQSVDALGYSMLHYFLDIDKALAFFKINTTNCSGSFHAYDSLANAYAIKGDKESAIKNYKKSLELNPNNQNAVEQLKKLEQQ